jgi:hypothetical protein
MDFDLPTARAMLARTPATLRAMLAGLDERWTEPDYGPDTWSAREVVAHLIFGEQTDWIPRARILLAHAEARPFDSFDRAGHKPLMIGATVADLLDLFERERASSLRALDALALTPADLQRRACHPALGTVTLANLLATWVVHDLNHLAQIAKAMAFQYAPQVGPWERYLSVLAPPNPR